MGNDSGYVCGVDNKGRDVIYTYDKEGKVAGKLIFNDIKDYTILAQWLLNKKDENLKKWNKKQKETSEDNVTKEEYSEFKDFQNWKKEQLNKQFTGEKEKPIITHNEGKFKTFIKKYWGWFVIGFIVIYSIYDKYGGT